MINSRVMKILMEYYRGKDFTVSQVRHDEDGVYFYTIDYENTLEEIFLRYENHKNIVKINWRVEV